MSRASQCISTDRKKQRQQTIQYSDVIQLDENDVVKRRQNDHKKRTKLNCEFIMMDPSFTVLPTNSTIVVHCPVS